MPEIRTLGIRLCSPIPQLIQPASDRLDYIDTILRSGRVACRKIRNREFLRCSVVPYRIRTSYGVKQMLK
jgi:hypothetical protein